MDQSPELGIGLEDDVAATATVASVRSTLRHVLGPVKMHRSSATVSRGAEYLDVVYEVRVRHNRYYLSAKVRNFFKFTFPDSVKGK